jgi:hypothetical protein
MIESTNEFLRVWDRIEGTINKLIAEDREPTLDEAIALVRDGCAVVKASGMALMQIAEHTRGVLKPFKP